MKIAKINTSQMQAPSKPLNLVLAINKHLKAASWPQPLLCLFRICPLDGTEVLFHTDCIPLRRMPLTGRATLPSTMPVSIAPRARPSPSSSCCSGARGASCCPTRQGKPPSVWPSGSTRKVQMKGSVRVRLLVQLRISRMHSLVGNWD